MSGIARNTPMESRGSHGGKRRKADNHDRPVPRPAGKIGSKVAGLHVPSTESDG